MNGAISFTEFQNKKIVRTNGKAKIVWAYKEAKPVFLMDFEAEASKNDTDIYMEGYTHYTELYNHMSSKK